MYILTEDMRRAFIGGLSTKKAPYARLLPTKLIKNQIDIEFGAVKLFVSGTPFRLSLSNDPNQKFMKEKDPLKDIVGTPIPDTEGKLLKNTLKPIVKDVWSYFNKMQPPATQADFDNFHEELCDLFLTQFSIAGYTYSYGNAQKFVNMLFKYLSCYKDSQSFDEWFKFCHMALDGFTYHSGNRLKYYEDVVYKVLYPSSKRSFKAWTQMDKLDDPSVTPVIIGYKSVASDIIKYIPTHPKTYNEYLDIRSEFPILPGIARPLDSIKPLSPEEDYELTPFEAEFFIWTYATWCAKKDKDDVYIYDISVVNNVRDRLN